MLDVSSWCKIQSDITHYSFDEFTDAVIYSRSFQDPFWEITLKEAEQTLTPSAYEAIASSYDGYALRVGVSSMSVLPQSQRWDLYLGIANKAADNIYWQAVVYDESDSYN